MTTNPKGKTPTLLALSTGKPVVETAGRKSKCNRCKGDILSGEKFFRIPKKESGFTKNKKICLKCFRKILEKTKEDISILEIELSNA